MNRIDAKFQALRAEGKKALITYMVAGDPSLEETVDLVVAKAEAGADVVELGIPFSDPLADGSVIQAAAQRSLNKGTNADGVFNTVRAIRQKSQVPLVFLVYYNSVLAYGRDRFLAQCKDAGVDGLIIPDLPFEEKEEMSDLMDDSVHLIILVAPTSDQRIEELVKDAKGFVYCISTVGITGGAKGFADDLQTFLGKVKSQTDTPIALGFGITKKEQVAPLLPMVDGVIMGSKIVDVIHQNRGDTGKVDAFVRSIKEEF
jgi:tryptophan synthase alpha chain